MGHRAAARHAGLQQSASWDNLTAMRRVMLILSLLCWTASQALAAGCPMTGAPAPEHASHQHHHPTPDHAPAHHSTECGMGMPCGVAAVPTGGDEHLAAPAAGRGAPIHPLPPHAAPDLAAEPPPPRTPLP